jgi:hypothetical protein
MFSLHFNNRRLINQNFKRLLSYSLLIFEQQVLELFTVRVSAGSVRFWERGVVPFADVFNTALPRISLKLDSWSPTLIIPAMIDDWTLAPKINVDEVGVAQISWSPVVCVNWSAVERCVQVVNICILIIRKWSLWLSSPPLFNRRQSTFKWRQTIFIILWLVRIQNWLLTFENYHWRPVDNLFLFQLGNHLKFFGSGRFLLFFFFFFHEI